MPQLSGETIKLIAQLASTLLAFVALVVALRNEVRNQRRFDTQLDQSRRVAEASAKPILSVAIRNHGPGTAIIREIKFVRGKDEASQVCVLLNVERYPEIQWNEDTEFVCPCYIDGKSVEDAFRVDAEHLRGGGVQRNGLKK